MRAFSALRRSPRVTSAPGPGSELADRRGERPGGGIRTPGRLAPSTGYQPAAFGRSSHASLVTACGVQSRSHRWSQPCKHGGSTSMPESLNRGQITPGVHPELETQGPRILPPAEPKTSRIRSYVLFSRGHDHHLEHPATSWLTGDIPVRVVLGGRRWRITDTPTRFRHSIWPVPAEPHHGLCGWRFQGTDDDGASLVFDVYKGEDGWHVHKSYRKPPAHPVLRAGSWVAVIVMSSISTRTANARMLLCVSRNSDRGKVWRSGESAGHSWGSRSRRDDRKSTAPPTWPPNTMPATAMMLRSLTVGPQPD